MDVDADVLRLVQRLKAAIEDWEAARMSDQQFRAYVVRTALATNQKEVGG